MRKRPGDAKLRIFLFQLLAVMGQWERALTQLKVAADLDPTTLPMVQTYRTRPAHARAMRSDGVRGQAPRRHCSASPPMDGAAGARRCGSSRQGQFEAGRTLRERAFEDAPATAAERIDGKLFAWIADADSRLGPMLEADHQRSLLLDPVRTARGASQFEKPADLRDLAWMPVDADASPTAARPWR